MAASNVKWVEFPLGTKYSGNVHPVNAPPDGCVSMMDIDPIRKPGSWLPRAGNENLIAGDNGVPAFPPAVQLAGIHHIGEVILRDGTRRIAVVANYDDGGNTAYDGLFIYNPSTGAWEPPEGLGSVNGATEGTSSLVCFNGDVRVFGDLGMKWFGSITNYGAKAFRTDANGISLPTGSVDSHDNDLTPKIEVSAFNRYWDIGCSDNGTGGAYPAGWVAYGISFVYEGGQEGPLIIPYDITLAFPWSSTVNLNHKIAVTLIRYIGSVNLTNQFRIKKIKVYSKSSTVVPTVAVVATWKSSDFFLVKEYTIIPVNEEEYDNLSWAWFSGDQSFHIGFSDTGENRIKTFASETGIVDLAQQRIPLNALIIGKDYCPLRKYASVANDRFIFGGVRTAFQEDVSSFYWSHVNRYAACYDIVPPLNQARLGNAGFWRGAMATRGYRVIIGSSGFLIGQNVGGGQSFRIDQAEVPIGCIARNSIAQTPDGPMFLSRSGFYMIQGLNAIGPIAEEIFADIRSYPDAAKALAMGKYSARHECYYFYIPDYTDTVPNPDVIYPEKFYAYHIPSRSVLPRTVSGNGTIYAMAEDVRNGVIVCDSWVNMGIFTQIARLETRPRYMDLSNSTPAPYLQSGYRHFGEDGTEHASKQFNFYHKTGVNTKVIPSTLEPTSGSINARTISLSSSYTMGRAKMPTTLQPALWHSIDIRPSGSLLDPNYLITGTPPNLTDVYIDPDFLPPQGRGMVGGEDGWEILRPHMRVVFTQRKMK